MVTFPFGKAILFRSAAEPGIVGDLLHPVPVSELARARVAAPEDEPKGGAAGEALPEPGVVLTDAADDRLVCLAQVAFETVRPGAPRELAPRCERQLLELVKRSGPSKSRVGELFF